MTQLEKQVNEIHTMVSVIKKSVGDHDKVLFGNGQPGLKDRVITIETNQSSNKNSIAMGISIVTTIIALGALAVTAMT